jgi:hypothetical protein
MTDDIVTRLRAHHEWFALAGQPTSIWEDAADEIERLRAEVAYLKTPCPRCDYEEPND